MARLSRLYLGTVAKRLSWNVCALMSNVLVTKWCRLVSLQTYIHYYRKSPNKMPFYHKILSISICNKFFHYA